METTASSTTGKEHSGTAVNEVRCSKRLPKTKFWPATADNFSDRVRPQSCERPSGKSLAEPERIAHTARFDLKDRLRMTTAHALKPRAPAGASPSTRRSRKAAFEKKLREYRTFLRNDFDWDWAYILRLLRYKLERTRKCIVANNIIVGARRVGREIREVERLLERVTADRYYEQIARPFHRKYGRLKMVFGERDPRTKTRAVTFTYARETPRTRERIHREADRLHRQAEKMQRDDLKRAFAFMQERIWGWWD